MKIEKGKFYKSRNGQKWEALITERNGKINIVAMGEDGSVIVLHQNGALWDDKTESSFDLIAEWTEPVDIPWSDYPTWCKWVAMDADRRWFGYEFKPCKKNVTWSDAPLIKIHPDYTPRNFTGHWAESLFERP
jgi:hypothetical protein